MKTAVALGTFDGIHIAHRLVLDLPNGSKKTAVTFLKPPKMVLFKNYELLMNFEDKVKAFEQMGFEDVLALDFEKVKDQSPQEFLDFLYETYKPQIISCGFNFRFGKNGEGNTAFLQEYCDKKGICLKVCDEVKNDGVLVSSSYIRDLLKQGEIEKANALLSVPFSYSGKVIEGDKRGRTMGFPTINQRYPEELVKLKFGVYKVRVLFDGKEYDGITNIGIRPTFETDYVISETYINDFSGDLYGKNVRIMPQKFLRGEVKFSSIEELKNQIEADINYIK